MAGHTHFPSYFPSYRFIPWNLDAITTSTGSVHLCGWVRLPRGLVVCWGTGLEPEERLVASCGPVLLARPETPAEEDERLQGEAEAAWEAHYRSLWSC